MTKKVQRLPTQLVEAFRVIADSELGSVACLLIDEPGRSSTGFSAEMMRVLAAWQHLDMRWAQVSKQPDDGRPTPAAWRWLCNGLIIDYDQLAAIAHVSRPSARAHASALLGNRLIFPDGSLSKPARASLVAHARRALGIKNQGQGGGQRESEGTN